jgi:geranylgeranyl pyrophosphate synthase
MISNQSIKAILTMNEELNVTGESDLRQGSKRLRSALLIDTSQIAGLHTTSCSSNEGDVKEQSFQVAGD